MLFLAIMAGVVLLLAAFSLSYAIQNGHPRFFLSLMTGLSLVVMIFAIVKLPYWHHNSQSSTSTSSSTLNSSQAAKSFSSSQSAHSVPVFNEAKEKQQAASQKLKEDSVLKQLQTNYTDVGTFKFDQSAKTYTLTPTSAKYVKALRTVQQHPGQNKKARASIEDSYTGLSKSIAKALGKGYQIVVLNPDNQDKQLLVVKDGDITTNNLN